MRIISGSFKGKKILEPKDNKTRPLKDLTKESIFNIIRHSNKFKISFKLISFPLQYIQDFTYLSLDCSLTLCCISSFIVRRYARSLLLCFSLKCILKKINLCKHKYDYYISLNNPQGIKFFCHCFDQGIIQGMELLKH